MTRLRVTWSVCLALGLVAIALGGCGGSESKQQQCQAMTEKAEHDVCVAELRHEEFAEHCAETGLALAEYGECIHRESAERRQEESPEPEAKASEPVEEPGGPLSYVGTIKVNNEAGTTYIDRYKIGPLSYGEEAPPPAAVLEACGTDSPSEAAASVFARGEIEATYSEGSLPDTIAVAEEGTVRSTSDEPEFGGVLQVASFLGGEWRCLGQEESDYEIQPGKTIDIPIWFVGDLVLSNERPRLGEEEIDSLYFSPVGSMALGTASATAGYWQVSGPGAARCYGEPRLLLYGRGVRC